MALNVRRTSALNEHEVAGPSENSRSINRRGGDGAGQKRNRAILIVVTMRENCESLSQSYAIPEGLTRGQSKYGQPHPG